MKTKSFKSQRDMRARKKSKAWKPKSPVNALSGIFKSLKKKNDK